MSKNLRRIQSLEGRAGRNPFSGLSDDALQAALNATLSQLGDNGPPVGLSLPAMVTWFERELATVH